jgi:hypothetical protein
LNIQNNQPREALDEQNNLGNQQNDIENDNLNQVGPLLDDNVRLGANVHDPIQIRANQQPQQQQQPINEDNHWNPMEWDRAAEDLTWDRVIYATHIF